MKRSPRPSLRQLEVMSVLHRHPTATLRTLGDELGVSHVSVHQSLQTMRVNGWVVDRKLTPSGLATLRKAVSTLKASIGEVR